MSSAFQSNPRLASVCHLSYRVNEVAENVHKLERKEREGKGDEGESG